MCFHFFDIKKQQFFHNQNSAGTIGAAAHIIYIFPGFINIASRNTKTKAVLVAANKMKGDEL